MAKATSKTKSKASTSKRGRPSLLDDLTDSQRQKLANRVRRLREQGVSWDGEDGIRDQIPEVSSAVVGRRLLQEVGADDLIRVTSRSNGSSKKSTPKGKGKAAPKGKATTKKRAVVVKRGKGRSKDPS